METTIVRYRDAPPGLKPVIIHKFLIANDAADSVHMFTFESPESSWEETGSATDADHRQDSHRLQPAIALGK
jgi:hypothetical protein